MSTSPHSNTPSVLVPDNRGLTVRDIAYHRHPGDGTGDRSQAVTRTWQYEGAGLPGRPVSVTEQVAAESPSVTERFVYAGYSDVEKGLNLAGACVEHFDTAGSVRTRSLALTGTPLSVTRSLLNAGAYTSPHKV